MKKHDALLLGEKIKLIRKAKNISQEALGLEIQYARSAISEIETGKLECDIHMLRKIKKTLGIEGMPLLEPERHAFKDRLYIWYDIISKRDFDGAAQIQEELSAITFLTFDHEFNAYYHLFRCRLLIGYFKIEEAKEALITAETFCGEADNELMYHHYYIKATVEYYSGDCQKSLNFYHKAYKLMRGGYEENKWLYYNICHCSFRLGYYYNIVVFIENARNKVNTDAQKDYMDYIIDSQLAASYIHLGYVEKAKKLLIKCLEKAKNDDDMYFTDSIFYNLGILYTEVNDWDTALTYFDKSLDCVPNGSRPYLGTLYRKLWCYIKLKCFTPCTALLAEGKAMARKNEYFTMLFEALEHLLTLNSYESTKYIEDVTIPYVLEKYDRYIALEYCDLLMAHYKRKGTKCTKKYLQIADIAYGIYKEMRTGGVIE